MHPTVRYGFGFVLGRDDGGDGHFDRPPGPRRRDVRSPRRGARRRGGRPFPRRRPRVRRGRSAAGRVAVRRSTEESLPWTPGPRPPPWGSVAVRRGGRGGDRPHTPAGGPVRPRYPFAPASSGWSPCWAEPRPMRRSFRDGSAGHAGGDTSIVAPSTRNSPRRTVAPSMTWESNSKAVTGTVCVVLMPLACPANDS